MVKNGIISKLPYPGPADAAIYSTDDKSQLTIAQVMSEEGIDWEPCKKGKGSRKAGLEIVRMMLKNVLTGEGPGLYFMRKCKAAIALTPILPRDENDQDDVDTSGLDHHYDMIRYRCVSTTGGPVAHFTTSGNY